MKSRSIRTPLKRARGHGAGHDGTHHFWLERVSALALIPLCVWFMIELVSTLMTANHYVIVLWFRQPINLLLMPIFLFLMFFHSRLGIQVIIEDYIHHEGKKLALLLLNSALHILLGGACLLAVAQLHFRTF